MAIARAGEGSMRDAESALDQVISFAGNKITDEDVSVALGLVDIETLNSTVQAIAEHDSERVIQIVDEIVSRGYDLRNFCREMMTHIRALLIIKVAGFDAELVQLPQGEGERLSRLANSFSEQDLVRFFSILTKTEQEIRASSQPRFQLEIGLIKMIQAGRLYLLEDLIHQFEELQSRLPGGLPPVTPSSKSPAAPAKASGLRPATEKIRIPPSKPASSSEPSDETKPAIRDVIRDEVPSAKASGRSQENEIKNEIKEAPPVAYSAPPDFDALPPEPPSFAESFESDLPLMKARPASDASQNVSQSDSDRIKSAVEARGKRLFLSILDHAESIQIDSDALRIRFPVGAVKFKKDVESKDNRKLLDEICREVAGRSLSLVVTVGAEQESTPRQAAAAKPAPEDHSTVRAIADKFHGQVEIIKPDR
jgi:DNA polymerase-3 subunit gamma/tau